MNFAAYAGGPVFWTLVVLGAAGLIVFFERFVELRRAQIDWQAFIKGVVNVLESGGEDEALAICDDTPVPVAAVAAAAIRHRGGSFLSLREAVDARGRAEVGKLDRRLALLAIIGQAAPLLGLLGTILGFTATLMQVSSEPIVPRGELVRGALGTLFLAAEGLMVAIPAGIMYSALRLRLERIISDMEAAATEIVGYLVSGKGVRK